MLKKSLIRLSLVVSVAGIETASGTGARNDFLAIIQDHDSNAHLISVQIKRIIFCQKFPTVWWKSTNSYVL